MSSVFCCLCLTVRPFFLPFSFFLYPFQDERLLKLEVWVFRGKVYCSLCLVFAIGMMPIQNFDPLIKLRICFLGENWGRFPFLYGYGYTGCIFWTFEWSVSVVKLGKSWTYAFASFLLACWSCLLPQAVSPQDPFVDHLDLQSPAHSLGHSPRPPGPAAHQPNWRQSQANVHLQLKWTSFWLVEPEAPPLF